MTGAEVVLPCDEMVIIGSKHVLIVDNCVATISGLERNGGKVGESDKFMLDAGKFALSGSE